VVQDQIGARDPGQGDARDRKCVPPKGKDAIAPDNRKVQAGIGHRAKAKGAKVDLVGAIGKVGDPVIAIARREVQDIWPAAAASKGIRIVAAHLAEVIPDKHVFAAGQTCHIRVERKVGIDHVDRKLKAQRRSVRLEHPPCHRRAGPVCAQFAAIGIEHPGRDFAGWPVDRAARDAVRAMRFPKRILNL